MGSPEVPSVLTLISPQILFELRPPLQPQPQLPRLTLCVLVPEVFPALLAPAQFIFLCQTDRLPICSPGQLLLSPDPGQMFSLLLQLPLNFLRTHPILTPLKKKVGFFLLLLFVLLLFSGYGCFCSPVCLCTTIGMVHAVPVAARRGHQITLALEIQL